MFREFAPPTIAFRLPELSFRKCPEKVKAGQTGLPNTESPSLHFLHHFSFQVSRFRRWKPLATYLQARIPSMNISLLHENFDFRHCLQSAERLGAAPRLDCMQALGQTWLISGCW